ncbi:hypothetical protein fnug_11 [Pseudomonas phage fnug]|uniref:Uncharacterized protein n=2 Tax=Phikzvirus TaxID=680115 RepID=A0AAE7S707_9CAUD|nr:hypothetical protein [Pseudomonas aeruginosa]QJB22654.1 hypothetical protein fnug_11 [Pseudomonas phage fnug]QXN68703.1 hypothetical protein [Pseudomonas phage PA7]UNI71865.1 hypothetical protein Churi01_gp341 [Pseudomonas phage Churi01]WAX23547.1 hypothetical protein [Pseudomonas phage pPA-N1803-4At.2]
MKAIALVVVGMVFGGLFINANYDNGSKTTAQEEVVLGHRIAPNGVEILVTK